MSFVSIFAKHVNHIVDSNNALHAPLRINHRDRLYAVRCEQVRDLLLIGDI